MIIEKLEPYYSSRTSRDGIRWEIRPNLEDVINKINEIIDAINAPTVDAEPVKRGRWIKVEDDYNNHLYECSFCHTLTSLPTEEDKDPHIRYCWSCGAKMER